MAYEYLHKIACEYIQNLYIGIRNNIYVKSIYMSNRDNVTHHPVISYTYIDNRGIPSISAVNIDIEEFNSLIKEYREIRLNEVLK